MLVQFTVGDPSGDGHERTTTYLYDVAVRFGDPRDFKVRERFEDQAKKLGLTHIKDLEQLEEYGIAIVTGPLVAELATLALTAPKEWGLAEALDEANAGLGGAFFHPQSYANFFASIAFYGLEYHEVKPLNVNVGGYGLFGS